MNHKEICNNSSIKIDLVYTWVDNKDLNWLEKKAHYDKTVLNLDKDANDTCRYFNNDELKYSLRSVEKNAPWVNKIYIITDNQRPEWLNLNNPKIKIIDHKDIIPKDKLPLYNACAIENAMCNIEDLSEYFIYLNDDMFFWEQVEPSFFFEDNKAIFRVDKKIRKFKKYKHLYGSMIFKAYSTIKHKLNIDIPYFPHHNADGYIKSSFLNCIKEFKQEFDITLNNRFRDFSDLQRVIFSYYSCGNNTAVIKKGLNWFEKNIKKQTPDSDFFDIRSKNITKIAKSKAKLICLNDSRKTTDEDRAKIKEIMENKFPQKSEFEV